MPWDTTLASLLWLIICVVLIVGLAYWFTRYVAGRGMLGGLSGGRRLEILDQLSLGRDQRILLARAGERYLLLGATPSGISLLAELTAEEAAAWQKPPEEGERPSFPEAFFTIMKQKERR